MRKKLDTTDLPGIAHALVVLVVADGQPGHQRAGAVAQIGYLADEWPRLIRHLDDGRIEVSNVLCENAIRPFVVGRKAWLFCDTPAGAHASARLYSLVESAKANGLNVYDYLKRVFTLLPQATTLANVEALLPWSQPATQSVAA